MKLEVKDYSYETMPDYNEYVEGAKEIVMSGDEIGLRYINDVIYDHKNGVDLTLQIIKPSIFNKPEQLFPCIVFIQGSAWMKQDVYRNVCSLAKLAEKGYVVSIVKYRSSDIAHFPAQIIDGKNAIRYLRANANKYMIDKNDFIIMGDSSGGHTSAMIGMSANSDLFDEPINDESVDVKAIIDLYGAINVTREDAYPTTLNHQRIDSPEGMLMGFDILENTEKAKIANVKEYVHLDFSPMLILHGTKDKTVNCDLSVELYKALKNANKDVEFYFVRNSDHGGAKFFDQEAVDIYDNFIKRCL